MKKHFLKSFALIAMLFSAISINAGSAWCNRVIGHFDPNGVGDKDDKSYVRLTVQDNQDGTISFIVAADPTLPKAAPDVDYVLINPGIGTAGDDATALESQTVKYSVPAGTEKITVEILWSYSNWGGRYMVQNLEIPLSEICGTNDSGEGGDTPATPTEVYDVNFALASNGATATASSGDATLAIDGNLGTRWESAQEDPQTWTLDLGQERIFNTFEIVWEGAYGKTFTVSTSSDNKTWTPAWTVEGQTLAGFPYTQTQTIDKTTARYIKFHGTARGTGYGYSFWEFRVYLAGTSTLTSLEAKPATNLTKVGETNTITITPKDQNGKVMTGVGEVTYTITPADAGTITNNVYTPNKIGNASIVAAIGDVKAAAFEVFAYDGENVALSTDINNSKIIAQSDFAPNGTNAWHAIDGNEGSVWQGSATNGTDNDDEARTYDSWFVVDCGAYFDVNLVSIKFEGACSQNYHVDFSADNTTWATAYTHEGNAGVNGHTKLLYGDDLQNKTKVRYIRFWSTKAATQYGMKIFEFKVFGTPWVAPADNVKPVMGTATLVSKTFNAAIIAVTATDNTEVGSYHVVDATKAYDQKCGVTEGQITVKGLQPATTYNFTISALDLAGNESENSVQLTVTTENHLLKPTAAPAVPTVDAKKVIALFSDTYPTDNNFTAHESWGDATIYEELTFGDNKVRYYTNLNWLGWQYINTPINALNMEKLHLDIWAENDGSLKVTPIYGGTGLETDDKKGKVVQLQGQQWNSIDLDLATDFVGLDLSSIYQFKFDGATGGTTFAIDNVYFYRVSEIADTETPTDVTATLKSVSFTSVVITCQATDNSGNVSFDIFDGETKLATGGTKSGVETDITVANLKAGTSYNLSVVAYDVNENKAETVVVAATTTALPASAPVPTAKAEYVMSIYSNAYTPAWTSLNSFNERWWNAPNMVEMELAEGDNALYYFGFIDGIIGWQFASIDATDYTTFTMDIYPMNSGTISFGPIGEGSLEYVVTNIPVTGNQWNTITIDLTGKDLTKIFQVKMSDYYALQSFFVDNVYLYKAEPSTPTNVENMLNATQSQKILHNGVLYIIRNGVTYDVTGRVVR